MDPLHDYQARGVAWCRKIKRGLVDVDMGLGKTRIMLELIKQLDMSALVVAPLKVCQLTWPEEITKWAPELTYHHMHGTQKNFLYDVPARVKIVNYEGLKWLLSKYEKAPSKLHNRILIIDESTKIKNPSSVAFKALCKMRHSFPYIFPMSASPLPNGYIGLWSQYFMVDEGALLGRTFSAYKNNYFIDLGAPSYRILPRNKDVYKVIQDKVAPVTFRLDASDYFKMPPMVVVERHVTLPSKALEFYKTMENTGIVNVENNEVVAQSESTQQMFLRQIIQGGLYKEVGQHDYHCLHEAKVDMLESIIEQANGNPLLVAIQFKFEVDMLTKRFGPLPIMAGGCKNPLELKHQWNAGQLPVLLCHPAAIGHGLNMQEGGHHLVWYSPTWDWEQYHQLGGRLRRQGQRNQVICTHIVAKGTLDEVIFRALATKGLTQQQFNDAIKLALAGVR